MVCYVAPHVATCGVWILTDCVWSVQRSLNGYIHGDFGAGAICNEGDTCSVSNTFTGTGFGTVMPGANVVSNNGGIWNQGANAFGDATSDTVCLACACSPAPLYLHTPSPHTRHSTRVAL